ncbi:hypothetical protein AAFF_G00140710 [Aldrovandia affinis]|uniref:Uncharacterized protein n=1 Tax=Aldrovandia affinis TaxID=143900 RepID=A0AAD7X2S0_9TELE|nr:hypothetical protein AAFF_G00140710 [Aldrovandia affinis]
MCLKVDEQAKRCGRWPLRDGGTGPDRGEQPVGFCSARRSARCPVRKEVNLTDVALENVHTLRASPRHADRRPISLCSSSGHFALPPQGGKNSGCGGLTLSYITSERRGGGRPGPELESVVTPAESRGTCPIKPPYNTAIAHARKSAITQGDPNCAANANLFSVEESRSKPQEWRNSASRRSEMTFWTGSRTRGFGAQPPEARSSSLLIPRRESSHTSRIPQTSPPAARRPAGLRWAPLRSECSCRPAAFNPNNNELLHGSPSASL